MVVSVNSIIVAQHWRVSSFFSFLFLVSHLSHLYVTFLNIKKKKKDSSNTTAGMQPTVVSTVKN